MAMNKFKLSTWFAQKLKMSDVRNRFVLIQPVVGNSNSFLLRESGVGSR